MGICSQTTSFQAISQNRAELDLLLSWAISESWLLSPDGTHGGRVVVTVSLYRAPGIAVPSAANI